jgi:hypothetical protein
VVLSTNSAFNDLTILPVESDRNAGALRPRTFGSFAFKPTHKNFADRVVAYLPGICSHVFGLIARISKVDLAPFSEAFLFSWTRNSTLLAGRDEKLPGIS